MAYTVLARRYRPEGFGDLVGQDHAVQTLKNAISLGRIGHAYLFTGPRGVGKTSAARVLAKALACEKGTSPEPCLVCPTCTAIARGHAGDVMEIDAASNNSVDDIREICDKAGYAPLSSPYKIYIIDEVHMVSRPGFNALLKTLEEPPAHLVFIFATTEAHKIPDTILSRCWRFDFAAIGEDDIAGRLRQIAAAEKIAVEEPALRALARHAEGGMRDAQTCLDQLVCFAKGGAVTEHHVAELLGLLAAEETLALLEKARAKDFPGLLESARALRERHVRVESVMNQLHRLLRDLVQLRHLGPGAGAGLLPPEILERARGYAAAQADMFFLAAADLVQNAKAQVARGLDPHWGLELLLLNLAHLGEMKSIAEILGLLVDGKKKSSS